MLAQTREAARGEVVVDDGTLERKGIDPAVFRDAFARIGRDAPADGKRRARAGADTQEHRAPMQIVSRDGAKRKGGDVVEKQRFREAVAQIRRSVFRKPPRHLARKVHPV